MSEQLERMHAGKLYDPSDAELAALRLKAHKLSRQYNNTDEDEEKLRAEILRQLTPNAKPGLFLQGPVYFDYGVFTSFGRNCYANFNFTVLDCCPVTIGDDVFFGPNCSLLTPMHSFLSAERNIRTRPDGSAYDLEYAKPISIGSNCWLAGNVTVCGGVMIGDGCVIGAGSVVTRDIPPGYLAAGNPCRVIRKISEQDSVELKNLI